MLRADAVKGGLGQSLVVWVAVVVALAFTRQIAVAGALFGAGLLSVIVLGQWHRRHARRDTAAGAFTGAVLWPILIGLTIVLINIASMSLSDVE
ncbi:heme O synthase-like polyprenyltransferase [Actinoplanes lutulentus]|nr:hypothetical protein [Actinoplanes lutulentus]MBB2942342.1 heme O synthase-like polyprenyltransferase [Actinoplanes lutulentus]